jgi:aminotransferase
MGVARGLTTLDRDFYDDISADYRRKRDLICSALAEAGLTPNIPQGAYYVLADISRIPGADSKERAMHLLRTTGVACVPGQAFYHDEAGESLARFCFAKDGSVIIDACNRLRRI